MVVPVVVHALRLVVQYVLLHVLHLVDRIRVLLLVEPLVLHLVVVHVHHLLVDLLVV